MQGSGSSSPRVGTAAVPIAVHPQIDAVPSICSVHGMHWHSWVKHWSNQDQN